MKNFDKAFKLFCRFPGRAKRTVYAEFGNPATLAFMLQEAKNVGCTDFMLQTFRVQAGDLDNVLIDTRELP
jgi:hypothetical protein